MYRSQGEKSLSGIEGRKNFENICFQGPILVEQLFQIVSCNLDENVWSNLFNNPTQLSSFLRLFSDSFHIQSNLVTLLQSPKISQKHITAQVGALHPHLVFCAFRKFRYSLLMLVG